MDTHHGKYQGPLAALLERWTGEYGERGDEEYYNSDIGEGTILFKAPITLSYSDAMYLKGEMFEATDEDLALLDKELSHAQGVAFSWDSQGFLYGYSFDTVAEYKEAAEELARLNAEEAEDD